MISNKKISLIYASTLDGLIGDSEGNIPWKCSADMKHFKEKTTGSTIIMGRKTFESIGRPLPNRQNIVLTRRGSISGVEVSNSIKTAVEKAKEDIMIIGGAEIYEQYLPYADFIWRTILNLNLDIEGTFFKPDLSGFKKVFTTEILSDNISGVVEGLIRDES